MRVEWEDLLARGFRTGGRGDGPLDCGGVTEEILVRARRVERGQLVIPPYDRDGAGEALAEVLSTSERTFVRIGDQPGDARIPGDFAVTDPSGEGYGTHLLVLVDDHPRTWLTALEGVGIRSTTDRGVGKVLGIYRVRP